MRNRTLLVAMVMIAVAAAVLVALNFMQRYGGKKAAPVPPSPPQQEAQLPAPDKPAPMAQYASTPPPDASASLDSPPPRQAIQPQTASALVKPQPLPAAPPPEFPLKQNFSPTGHDTPRAAPAADRDADRPSAHEKRQADKAPEKAPEKAPAKPHETKTAEIKTPVAPPPPPPPAKEEPKKEEARKDDPKADKNKTGPAHPEKAAEKAPEKAPEKVAAKDAPPAKPAAKAERGVVSAIRPAAKGDDFVLNVDAVGGPQVKYLLLDSPPRLSVDLLGEWRWSGSDQIKSASPLVKGVRVGHHQDRLRLVIDLSQKDVKPSVEETDKGVVITVGKGK